MQPVRRFGALAALLLLLPLTGGLASCGDDDEAQRPAADAGAERSGSEAGASPEAPTEIVGGRTVLKLDPDVERVLDAAQVDLAPVGEATDAATGVALPITDGRLDIDTPSGTIEHAGGLEFSALGRSVRAENLVVEVEDGVVTAEIDGERIPLLTADVGRPRVVPPSDTVVLPSEVKVGDRAVRRLNDALGVEVFEDGLRLGRLTVSGKRP